MNFVVNQIPGLIEKFEPMLESTLRSNLKKVKAEHPEKSAVFLTNWRKLNTAIEAELGAPAVAKIGARRKRTRRTHRSKK
jgi:hypothetical protein